jgi:hypothetical protein
MHMQASSTTFVVVHHQRVHVVALNISMLQLCDQLHSMIATGARVTTLMTKFYERYKSHAYLTCGFLPGMKGGALRSWSEHNSNLFRAA